MLILNESGLTDKEVEKILHPYSSCGGSYDNKIDFAQVGEAAVRFLDHNPEIISDVGKLLDGRSEV